MMPAPLRFITAATLVALSLTPAGRAFADATCTASNSVTYHTTHIFDSNHACYAATVNSCPATGSICANLALIKLANYSNTDTYQDLLYSPHRGLWGQTYGSTDTTNYDTPPAQNTNQAFALAASFATTNTTNNQGKPYGAFLRGRLLEIDITTSGNDVSSTQAIVDHFQTTDNSMKGSINAYLSDMTSTELSNNNGQIEKRDFSASPMTLSQTKLASVTTTSLLDSGGTNGSIVFLDIKARRGDIQCRTAQLTSSTNDYINYNCKYNEPEFSDAEDFKAEILAAQTMYEAGATSSIVIKETGTFDETVDAFVSYYSSTREEAIAKMKRYMWQPHPKYSTVQENVQYIHDWLVNMARSVAAWEMNIYYKGDVPNKMFCITAYSPTPTTEHPYGTITTRQDLASMNDTADCQYGPYQNTLDYLRQETGTANYFGFTTAQTNENLISGNRANLWLLETASASGTADRYYLWQMVGSEPTYNMSDPVRYLNYPYVAYQIMNGDRMDAMYDVIVKGLYPKWGTSGQVTTPP